MSRISRVGEHLVINLDKQTINYDSEEIHPFKRDKLLFALLEYFCENPGIALSIDKIDSYVHDGAASCSDGSIRNLIGRLRGLHPELAAAIKKTSNGYLYDGSRILDSEKAAPIDNGDTFSKQETSQPYNEEHSLHSESRVSSNDTRSDSDVIIDNMRKPLMVLAEAMKVHEHETAEKIRSNELFSAFRNDYDRILKYCINTDPCVEPISIHLHDEIKELQNKWELDIRKVSNSERHNLMQDIITTLSDYTYYLSDEFMRVVGNSDRIIYRNQSQEEANRFRNEFSPKTFELRCKIKELYERIWPIPNAEQSDAKKDTSSTESSHNGKTADIEEPQKPVVHQTVVNQYGDNSVHIDHVDTLNL